MQMIKLDAIDSTNLFLKDLIRQGNLQDNTVVITAYQTHGRGQADGSWVSEHGKNLMFSVLKIIDNFKVDQQFYLSMASALAIYHALKKNNIPNLTVKWPNDILSGNKKIGGILIENSLKNDKIASSVIGIGLNINQTDFSYLPQASSLKMITGITYDIDEILHNILREFQNYADLLEAHAFKTLKTQYETCLFRIHQPSDFEYKNGSFFSGIITGVSDAGKLIIMLEDKTQKSFSLKEIKFLY